MISTSTASFVWKTVLLCFMFEAFSKYFLTYEAHFPKIYEEYSMNSVLIIALEIIQCFSESQSPCSCDYDTTRRNCVKGVQMNMLRDLMFMNSQSQLNRAASTELWVPMACSKGSMETSLQEEM